MLIHDLRMSGEEIEAASFAVIDREAGPHGLSPAEWVVARRMIHATADFGLLKELRFHTGAVDAGVEALHAGAPIYADASMIRAGLSLSRLQAANPGYTSGSLHVHVGDPDVAREAARTALPRSLFALRKARPVLDGGVVAIGNAPVALLELNRLIAEEGVRPALVVAMPVGFVHVVESKEELLALDVPAIVLAGRRGGSPLAVAAIHALAALAKESA